jgi:sialate O-acetylesterase
VAGYGPSTSDPTRSRWAALREGQRKALTLPNTAMAVAIDVGDKDDIHPRNKGPVAERLALAAEHFAYGKDVVCSGPTFDSMRADGNRLRLTFKDIGTGLVLSVAPPLPDVPAPVPASELQGFEIAGADQKWFHATAVIDGASVIASSAEVAAPVAVRYAWGDIPACNLYNREGLPAVPFRSDSWDDKAAFETPK